MTMVGYTTIVVVVALILSFLYAIYQRRSLKNPAFTNWPFLGMLPQPLCNLWRIHDFLTEELIKSQGGTVEFIGPWFTNMNGMLTSDPMNVHHIMSKSFNNYVKGDLFREMFQAFGDGIFTADSQLWKYNRSLFHSLFKQTSFEVLHERIIHNKVERTLLPILDHLQQQGSVFDLQDVFNRFTFDNICSIILGYDPNCLSIEFPEVACEKAFNQAEESIFYRHAVPVFVWKFQRWLQIGQEKKLSEACKIFDQFLYACIASKREELSKKCNNKNELMAEDHVDLLSALIRGEEEEEEEEEKGLARDDKFLRDAAFNLFVAGRDTITSALTWFFWLVATHPLVESKILKEIKDNFGDHKEKPGMILGVEEVKKLVYLHGAICEALRLFPPIPFERKEAIKDDILPSGHIVKPKTMILFSLYAMGRFEDIWGKDCLEFKPERWLSDRGGISYAPSYKFISFNAGPRTCLGKDLSFMQMKMVATAILWNYRIQVVDGNVVTPSHSIVLLMKYGLKVKITKRVV